MLLSLCQYDTYRIVRVLQIATFDPNQIQTVDELIKDYAEKVVKMVNGNTSKAAEMLGISRTSLWKILKDEE
jgi:two-component system response regulator HydG